MNAQFDPLGAVFLIAWLAVGGFAVFRFFRQPRRTIWQWASLIVGVVMVTGGILGAWIMLSVSR